MTQTSMTFDFVPTAQFTTAGWEPKLQILALSKWTNLAVATNFDSRTCIF